MTTITESGARGLTFSENLENNKILENLRNQRSQSKFCDIVLNVEKERLPGHRSILAASSPYFESILKNHRVTKEEINIKWKNVDTFKVMLDYMYSGNITVDEANIGELLRLADHFLMTKLKNYCEIYLERFLSNENCFSTKDLADKYSLTKLKGSVSSFISDNIDLVLPQNEVLEMPFKKFETFLTDSSFGCNTAPVAILLTAIANWIKSDIPGRSQHLPAILQTIPWQDKDLKAITTHIENDTLYQENKISLFHLLRSLVESNVKIGKHYKTYEDLAVEYSNVAEVITGDTADDEEENDNGFEVEEEAISVEPVDAQGSGRVTRSRGSNGVVSIDDARGSRKRKPTFNSQEWVTTSAGKKTKTPPAKGKATMDSQESFDDSLSDDDEDYEEDGKRKKTKTPSGPDVEAAAWKRIAHRVESVDFASPEKWKEGIKCPHCSYLGHSATRLEQHLARVHEEDQTYKCKFCEFECKWNREYYKHMKTHFDGPPYKCEDCEYSCDRIQFIISHRMRHTDERPFTCELCEFSSRTKGNLIVHMRIHTGEKPYRCKHCGRCFAMKNTLDQHLATHRDDRPFLCDTCGFTTKYQSHLLSHKRIHTGNVFHCQQEGCSYFSPRRSQLAAHTRSHLSIRSHICSTCGRGFIEKSHLIRHERIHLEEKPFKCELCDYSSTRRDKLKEHVQKHHSDDPSAAPKSAYKPRRQKRATVVGMSDELTGQIILGEVETDGANMSEQDVATANLIYEYTAPDGTRETRVVIQNMAEFEGQAFLVEGQLKEEDDEESGGVVVATTSD